MIPDYQALMRPVLKCSSEGEVRVSDVVDQLADELNLTEKDRKELLPSAKQTRFSNRVHWAKSYLKQAGLVSATKWGHFVITDRGKAALNDASAKIDRTYLERFEEFKQFQAKTAAVGGADSTETKVEEASATPDEVLRAAHKNVNAALAAELLDRVREASPAFFETLIVALLVAMGYGGTSGESGHAIGKSGDDGVDGVIDQDPLGVDQIYVQAKRYADGSTIGPAAIRDFFGGLSLKKAQKGIFVTTSSFSTSAEQTARNLGTRIVLINGAELAGLMIRYNVGCREEETLYLKKIDEEFFE